MALGQKGSLVNIPKAFELDKTTVGVLLNVFVTKKLPEVSWPTALLIASKK